MRSNQINVASARLLADTYELAHLPDLHTGTAAGSTDEVSKTILQRCQPIVLEDRSPRRTVGDGNCFYRAVSLALYGTEAYHMKLRFITSLEIAENETFYSVPLFKENFTDVAIVQSEFASLLASLKQV